MRGGAATWRRGWRMRKSIGSASCGCSIWPDWRRTVDQRFAIFQALVRYRRYPDDLFAASRETEAQLREWYAP